MKKLISLALVLMLVVSLSVTAFAATTGSITINGVLTDNVYSIYKMLDLSLGGENNTAYTYTINAAWAGFFATTEAQQYIIINDAGAAVWDAADDDDTKATFAKMALAYAEAHGIDPVAISTNSADFTVTGTTGVFGGLELGYYLVDSTMGALCGLTTTNPNASINAKNGIPTITKQVKEDSLNEWGTENTADIGQLVEYRVTIDVHAGAQNYVLHDTMEDGLTFGSVTKIEHVQPGKDTHETPADKYTVKTGAAVTDGCDFEVVFAQSFCDQMEGNDKIVVYYTATLNNGADISSETNDNTAWLTFGDPEHTHESNKSTTQTKTFSIDIVKTDSEDKLIPGAEFKIYDAPTGGNEIAVVLGTDDIYRRAADQTSGDTIVVSTGKITVEGFDNGTYYLEETKEPAGYNKLTARQKFIINSDNLAATFNGNVYSSGSGVQVVNNTGSRLPETGGIGTLLFTVLGGGTALGTGVVLVTKKRMSKIEDED